MDFGSKNWINVLLDNGIDKNYMDRALKISFLKFYMLPFSVIDNAKLGKKLEDLEIKEPPIFILGHWRSGTTHLHNLMTQDTNFGYISHFQSVANPGFIAGDKILRPLYEKRISSNKRPMDNMYLSLNSPQEEEFAMMNMSFYHGLFHFPKNVIQYFNKYVLFDGDEKIRDQWKNSYLKVLKKVTYKLEGKRLVLKNPANTARIKILLEIFPNAKFIHIYRNPYVVYTSTLHMHKKLLETLALQNINEKTIEENVFFLYERVIKTFFEKQQYIPANNFTEVKYEDLELNPIKELERVYNELNLTGFSEAKSHFLKYIKEKNEYSKNFYSLDDKTAQKVKRHWGFTIEKWKYNLPE